MSRSFFTLRKTQMRMNLDLVDSSHFVLTWERRSLQVWSLAVRLWVCLQQRYAAVAAVPVRWKTCEHCDNVFRSHVFRSKRKAECNLREKATKRMRAVESDSVKSARKAKGKLHKACQRVSETCERTLHWQKQNRMHMASMRKSRDSDQFLVNTQVQSHALLRRGFGTSVPFIVNMAWRILQSTHTICPNSTF